MERLTVKNLGPLRDFTLKTNRLTVLIGPQASGKSLLMQLLYYVNDLKSLAAENHRDDISNEEWLNLILFFLPSQVRGTPITSFSNSTNGTDILYTSEDGFQYSARIDDTVVISDASTQLLLQLRDSWNENKRLLEIAQISNCIYIPSKRLAFSLFREKKESILYDSVQPPQMKRFFSRIEGSRYLYMLYSGLGLPNTSDDLDICTRLQWEALNGVVEYLDDRWSWRLPNKQHIDLSGLSSGQMSAWPFFLLASVLAKTDLPHYFYFEEPEIHLHPKSQIRVMQAVALLLAKGHKVFITTQSPFILSAINTLIQAHTASGGSPSAGECSINPDHVAAYCLPKSDSIVNPKTKLLDLAEIGSVFGEINVSFGKHLDREFATHGTT